MHFMDDDSYTPDDDTAGEWLAQAFEVATLNHGMRKSRNGEMKKRKPNGSTAGRRSR